MRIGELRWTSSGEWEPLGEVPADPGLVLYLGDRNVVRASPARAALRRRFAGAHLMGGSAMGLIRGAQLEEAGALAVAIALEAATVRLASREVDGADGSQGCGE